MNPTNKTTAKINKGNHSHTSSGSTEVKKTSSGSQKAQQVQPSGRNISQDIQNAKTIIDAAPQEHKKTMLSILDSKTHPNELISLANTINDKKTQQRAWVIIGNRKNIPAHIRLEATQNIQNDSIRKGFLKILAEDPTVNICLRLKAAQLIDDLHNIHDNQLYQRLLIEASKEGKSLLDNVISTPEFMRSPEALEAFENYSNADELFAIIATHPQCDGKLCFQAAQKIKDKMTQQNAYYCNIQNPKDMRYSLPDNIKWLECITDEAFLHFKELYLRNILDSDIFLIYNSSIQLQLISLISDKFLKEKEAYLWRLIADNNGSIDNKIQVAKLLSIEDQPKAFLYICEHATSLNSSQFKELLSSIPDEDFSREKQAVLKAIINNPQRATSVKVAAVQLMGSPYEDNVFTIINHHSHHQEHDINALLNVIKLIEDKGQQEDLIVELLSNFKYNYELYEKLNYALYRLQDPDLKARIVNKFLQNLSDPDFPKSHVPHTIYCLYQNDRESLSSFEWNARMFIECLESFSPYRVDLYFDQVISYIPQEQRDIILLELFKNMNLLAIQQNDNFNSNDYRILFQKLYDLSSEEARESLLFAIASNNNLEKDFRIQLITDIIPDNNEKREELLEIIEHSHEAQGGAIDPRRKHTTKRAR